MSSNEKIFRATGPLWGEYTGPRWIPLTKASDAGCFLWCAPEQTAEQIVDMLVIWDAVALIVTSLQYACDVTTRKGNLIMYFIYTS